MMITILFVSNFEMLYKNNEPDQQQNLTGL